MTVDEAKARIERMLRRLATRAKALEATWSIEGFKDAERYAKGTIAEARDLLKTILRELPEEKHFDTMGKRDKLEQEIKLVQAEIRANRQRYM